MSSQNSEEKNRRRQIWDKEQQKRDDFISGWKHVELYPEEATSEQVANWRNTEARISQLDHLSAASKLRKDVASYMLNEDFDTVIRNVAKKALGVPVHPEANLDPFSVLDYPRRPRLRQMKIRKFHQELEQSRTNRMILEAPEDFYATRSIYVKPTAEQKDVWRFQPRKNKLLP